MPIGVWILSQTKGLTGMLWKVPLVIFLLYQLCGASYEREQGNLQEMDGDFRRSEVEEEHAKAQSIDSKAPFVRPNGSAICRWKPR